MNYYEQYWVQTVIFVVQSSLVLMWLVDVKPFNNSIQNMVEIISEAITLLLGYHMVTFAGFNMPYSAR